MDYPGGTEDKSLPAKMEDLGLVPDPRGFHMLWATKVHRPQLLSRCSRAFEPQLGNPWEAAAEPSTPWSLCSTPGGATTVHCSEE